MNPLMNVPGLGGYLAGQQQQQANTMNQLQQVQGVMGIQQGMQQQAAAQKKQAQEQAFRNELAAAPTEEARLAVAAKYASPDKLLDIGTKSQDRVAALEQKKSEFEQRFEQQKNYAEMMHEYRMGRLQSDTDRQAETARHNKAMEALSAQNAQASRELQITRLELLGDRQQAERLRNVDRQVTSFANELQQNKIPALSASISTANDILKSYEDKDIPGFGIMEGSKYVPSAVRSEESNRVRSAVQAVSNDLLNLYSGLAVTLPESERRELEEMRGGNFTSADFKNGWPRIINRYNTVVGNLKAGANAEVLKEYQSRPGAMKLEPLAPAFNMQSFASEADAAKAAAEGKIKAGDRVRVGGKTGTWK